MAFPSIFALFVVSHLVLILHSAGEYHNTHQASCPQSFNCGTLGQIKFPFSNVTHPDCGLITVNCSEEVPKIHLGTGTGFWYEVKEFSLNGSMKVTEKWLGTLITLKSCDLFTFTLPNSSSISYTISPNLTLFKCANNAAQTNEFFRKKLNYTGCSGYTVYYTYPNDHQVPTIPGPFPPNCVSIQLPAAKTIGNRKTGDVFSLLASEFSLEFHVSNERRECHLSGGQCAPDLLEFQCIKEKEGRSNLTLILGTVIPGGVILLLCLLILTIRRCNKWIYICSYISSTSTPSDPSSKADLEGGSVYFGVPVFSYTELEEATHNFDPSKELGDGGFGTVYHGKLQDGRQVAVKRLYEHNCKRVKQFMNEVEILTRLRHHNLVSLYGCTSRHSRELLLVYEYIPNGTLADHLHGNRAKDGSLTWPIRLNTAIETAGALAYLHASDIIHRDVKTSNILLDNNFGVKVADFGLSRLFPTDVSHVSTAPQGTPGYVDPEYHQCYQLTDKSDVYSFGVVLIELISSMPAVDISRHRHEINLADLAINRIQNGGINELIDPSLGFESDSLIERMATSVAEVAFRCLQLKKEMRPSMDEVLEDLKAIQEYKDENLGEEIDNVGVLASTRLPSPEGNDVMLLKNSNVP